MKKRTIFAIILSFIFIVIGGVGAFITQGQLVKERENNAINKKIPTKDNKQLDITINSSAKLNITRSDDRNIYMDKQGIDFKLDKKEQADCTFKEEKDTSSLTINNPTTSKSNPYPFMVFDLYSYSDDTIYLRVPSHFETININGKHVNLNIYDFTMNNINLNVENGEISLYNIKANQVTQQQNNTNVHVDSSKIQEKLSINSMYDIVVINTTAKEINLTSDMGDITTGNTKGDLALYSKDGGISVNHTSGKSTVETKHGDILFHDNNIDFDTILTSTNGDIDIETDSKSIDKNQIDFETNLGEISIFNKNLSSERKYKTDKGKISFKAISKNGDIEVEELDSDDTQYHYE